MSKSVLVIDTPETCVDCIFCQEYSTKSREYAYCYVTNGDSENDMKPIDCIYGYRQSKPDWCPLMELPEKDNGDYPANTCFTVHAVVLQRKWDIRRLLLILWNLKTEQV